MSDEPKYRTYPFHRPLRDGEEHALLNGLARPFPLEGWTLRYRVHDTQGHFRGLRITGSRIELEFMMQDVAYPILRLFFTSGAFLNPDWELFVINEGGHSVSSAKAAASLANRLLDGVFRAATKRKT